MCGTASAGIKHEAHLSAWRAWAFPRMFVALPTARRPCSPANQSHIGLAHLVADNDLPCCQEVLFPATVYHEPASLSNRMGAAGRMRSIDNDLAWSVNVKPRSGMNMGLHSGNRPIGTALANQIWRLLKAQGFSKPHGDELSHGSLTGNGGPDLGNPARWTVSLVRNLRAGSLVVTVGRPSRKAAFRWPLCCFCVIIG